MTDRSGPPLPAAGPDRLSIVMTVLNRATLLGASLATIVAQTRPAHEIVVVDGGSVDGTAEVARSFPGVVVVEAPGAGTATGYNLAVASSAGEIVAFASSDDLLDPAAAESHAGALGDRAECGMSVGLTEFFADTAAARTPPDLAGTVRRARVIEALAVRREVWERLGGFREDIGRSGFDLEWLSRLGDAGVAIAEIDRVVVRKRLHQANTSYRDAGTQEVMGGLRASLLRRRAGRP